MLVFVAVAAFVSNTVAQTPAPILQEPQTIPLWQDRAPGALGNAAEDIPTLTIYMPPNTTGPMTAVIVAPGGSYRALSMNKEGRAPANYLNALGIAAFVLKYRLGPTYHHPIEIGDMQRAIRTVRARAVEWHLDPVRIGVMGFSAGGHLASTASTHFDRVSSRCGKPGCRRKCTSSRTARMEPACRCRTRRCRSGPRSWRTGFARADSSSRRIARRAGTCLGTRR